MRPIAKRTGWGINRRGLTLTEVLLAGLFFALIGGMSLAMTQSGDQVWRRTDAQLASLTQAQVALDRLSEALREEAMQQGLTCGPGSTLVFSPVGEPPPPNVTYKLTGTNLIRAVGGVEKIVASGVQAFTPMCATGGPVVQLRVTAQVNAWREPLTLASQVWVQNP